jgi:hypothetical protein
MPTALTSTLIFALALHAHAAEKDGWQTVATGAITIKARSLPGSPIREILAEGDLDASALDLQKAVLDVERFPKFMPYVRETRFVEKPKGDGTRVVYTALGLPMVKGRDFVIVDRVVRALNADGTGEFITAWEVARDRVPARAGFVRVVTNTGSWKVSPKPGGKSHVVYQFAVDPGGAIPPFLADLGNRNGVGDVFKALEGEARRLQAARAATRGSRD